MRAVGMNVLVELQSSRRDVWQITKCDGRLNGIDFVEVDARAIHRNDILCLLDVCSPNIKELHNVRFCHRLRNQELGIHSKRQVSVVAWQRNRQRAVSWKDKGPRNLCDGSALHERIARELQVERQLIRDFYLRRFFNNLNIDLMIASGGMSEIQVNCREDWLGIAIVELDAQRTNQISSSTRRKADDERISVGDRWSLGSFVLN